MSRVRARGFTLTEMLIAMSLSLLMVTAVLAVFHFGLRAFDAASYSYMISRESYIAIKWLKKELMQTTLGSIRVYPDADRHKEEPPGGALVSASDPRGGRFTISAAGTPLWQKLVFYTVVPQGEVVVGTKRVKTGTLLRWEAALAGTNPVPFAPSILPSSFRSEYPTAPRRVILRDVVMGNQDLYGDDGKDPYGSFRISFVRRDPRTGEESLSPVNPALVRDESGGVPATASNTELVQVDLTILEMSRSTGEPNVLDLSFRVKPRN